MQVDRIIKMIWNKIVFIGFVLISFGLTSCVVDQTRGNPEDPLSTTFSNALLNKSTQAISFLVPAISSSADSYDQNPFFIDYLGITWFNSTKGAKLSNFNVYVTPSFSSLPTNAQFKGLSPSVTTATIKLLGPGENIFWVEAVAENNQRALVSNKINLRTGFTLDTRLGATSAPSLRCLNVPLGASKTVSFSMGEYSTAPGGTINGFSGTVRSSTNSGSLAIILSASNIDGSTALLVATNFIASGSEPTQFTSFTASLTTVITFQANKTIAWIITVTNISDPDGLNAVWLDDLTLSGVSGGTPVNLPVGFSPKPTLTGSLEF